MPGLVHNGALGFSGGGGRSRKARAPAMAAEIRRIVTKPFGRALYDDRNAFRRQVFFQHLAVAVHNPEQRRLWSSVIAYNLGNLWRRLAVPKKLMAGRWTSLQQWP